MGLLLLLLNTWFNNGLKSQDATCLHSVMFIQTSEYFANYQYIGSISVEILTNGFDIRSIHIYWVRTSLKIFLVNQMLDQV